MKLAHNEQIVAEYEIGEDKVVLTNRRLVILRGKNESHYPLDKITAVMIDHKILWKLVILGLLLIARATLLENLSPFIAVFLIIGLKGKRVLLIKNLGGDVFYSIGGIESKEVQKLYDLKDKILELI